MMIIVRTVLHGSVGLGPFEHTTRGAIDTQLPQPPGSNIDRQQIAAATNVPGRLKGR